MYRVITKCKFAYVVNINFKMIAIDFLSLLLSLGERRNQCSGCWDIAEEQTMFQSLH